MKKYAVLDNGNIAVNLIIAESLEVAERVTSSTCVFVSDDDTQFALGRLYSNGNFLDVPVEETPA